jgi:N-acetylglucosamine-6-phosphate deacetylase
MGLIDIHTHGMEGFDTRTASGKSVLEMARLYGRAGVECIVPTIYPASPETMRMNMEAVRRAMEMQRGAVDAENTGNAGNTDNAVSAPGSAAGMSAIGIPAVGIPAVGISAARMSAAGMSAIGIPVAGTSAARILGINLEGPFLNPARCGALDAASFLAPDEKLLNALVSGFEGIIRIITVAPELDGAPALIAAICGMGITVSMGHSDASWSDAEAGYRAGARGATHLFNAMRGLHHRQPGLAGFALMHPDVYVEVIADPFHLHPSVLDMVFKLKDHRRIIIVSDTVKESMAPSSTDGIKDAAGTLQGGCMALPRAVKRLVEMGYDEADVGMCASENPARYLGMTLGMTA